MGAVSFDCHIFQSLAGGIEAFGNDLTGEFVGDGYGTSGRFAYSVGRGRRRRKKALVRAAKPEQALIAMIDIVTEAGIVQADHAVDVH